jgi:hypothetical protein
MTNDIPATLRVRRVVSDWFPVVVAGLLLLTLLAGLGTYSAYASTEYETEEVVVSSLNESTDFEHSAVVRNESSIWTEGETVRNRPLYYMRLMPVLDVNYSYSYDLTGAEGGREGGDVTARTEAQLVIRAVNGDGETLWDDARPLASETSRSLSPGDTHQVSLSINATRVARRISQVESELGAATGDVQVLVRTRTSVSGSVAGQDRSREHTSELPLVVRPPTYRVGGERTVATGGPLRTDTLREAVAPPLLTGVGAPVGLLAGLAALGLLGYASRRDLIELSEAERERCLVAERRAEFDDWITSGELPGIDQYQTVVKVDSLSGLVDLAIDTNNRVIEDGDAFYVLRGREDVAYVYAPSTSQVHDWLFGGFDFAGEGSFPETGTAENGGDAFWGGTEAPDVESIFEDDGFGDAEGANGGDDTDAFEWPQEGDEDAEDDPWPGETEDAGGSDSQE